MKRIILLLFIPVMFYQCKAQYPLVPDVYHNLQKNMQGKIGLVNESVDTLALPTSEKPDFEYKKIVIMPDGTKNGIVFDFRDTTFKGKLYYGFINTRDVKYQQPIFFKKKSKIKKGKVKIKISKLSGKYDMVGWEKTGKLTMGYRITNKKGKIIYDGRINIKGVGPFTPDVTIIEGPFINQLHPESVVISFRTNTAVAAKVIVNGNTYTDEKAVRKHEFLIKNLTGEHHYAYRVIYGDWEENYEFTTPPANGTRKPFIFAFASDSRAGKGGGERNIYGVNGYILKRLAALAAYRKAAFFQFTGDMINGYSSSKGETNLEYANWKKVVEPYWHYMPFYVTMGNHEALIYNFKGLTAIDKFPFSTESAEAVFADNFVNAMNGPVSEDGAKYDPSPNQGDFPSYKENVYYYTYDNVAMVVMNSNYWYTPWNQQIAGGNVHGYVMDKQIEWLKQTIATLEADPDIDHIFLTLHTPPFPNGGHAGNDMWYMGDNAVRAYVDGKPVDKGIIERRDELLDILVNKSKKFIAILDGDEHNYSRMHLTKDTPIYPEGWTGKRLTISRKTYQLTNGAAGAPYYAREKLPWSDFVDTFSTQFALILFHVDGKKIEAEVVNPDTLELIERFQLR